MQELTEKDLQELAEREKDELGSWDINGHFSISREDLQDKFLCKTESEYIAYVDKLAGRGALALDSLYTRWQENKSKQETIAIFLGSHASEKGHLTVLAIRHEVNAEQMETYKPENIINQFYSYKLKMYGAV